MTDFQFSNCGRWVSHEIMHRWGSYVRFKDENGNISTALLGREGSHWSFLLDTSASVMLGNKWQDNGNGTFTSIDIMRYYSQLDLYLMGFIDKTRVPPMLLIENPSIDPARIPEEGVTITGTARHITIDDIIAAEGERVPDSVNSRKTFKSAFILITAPGTFTGAELYGIENVRNGGITRFSVLTDGNAILEVASALKDNVPANPGVLPPSVSPRTLPPDIEEGVAWLMNNQKADGSWMDLPQTVDRDTAEAALALKNFDIAVQNYDLGLRWLNATVSGNMDYLARKIESFVVAGNDATALIDELLSRQNLDGGWGSNRMYISNPLDTALALKALSAAGYANQSVIGKAIQYVKTKQTPDGGWGSDDGESTVQATANVLSAFRKYEDKYPLSDLISQGTTLLSRRQNPDGGFGNSPSTVYDTATAVLTLQRFNISKDAIHNALNYILNLQSQDGSWYESPYQTALAIEAVWKATIDPDLSIKTEDISVIPASIKSLPANIVINANIWNLGRQNVPQAKVVLYEGSIAEANKRGEQNVSFPGQAATTV